MDNNIIYIRDLPNGILKEYSFVIIVSILGRNHKILLSQKKGYTTWEFQGGHIEANESPECAAYRELYEEAGITECDLIPMFEYVTHEKDTHYGGDGESISRKGIIFVAQIFNIKELPNSEIGRVCEFDRRPDDWTYPEISEWIMKNIVNQIFPSF